MSIAAKEREKYARAWAIDDYSKFSPGLSHIDMFWSIASPKRGQSLIDVGCGAGAATRALKSRGLSVRGFDLTDTAWDHDDIPLTTGTIWRDLRGGPYDYAYCCDVMEHIPTEFVGLAIERILQVAPKAFFSISFTEDHFGDFVGEALHLTVKPFVWWRDLLRELGIVHEARDLMGEGVFYVAR